MKTYNKILLSLILIFCTLFATSCANSSNQKIKYYSNSENYVEVTGTINYVLFDDENEILYLGFSDLSEKFDDDCFKIVENNYSIILSGAEERIQVGKTATFVTAPKYFGDGYVMPIVALSIDDCRLLEYEIGIKNFLDWLKNNTKKELKKDEFAGLCRGCCCAVCGPMVLNGPDTDATLSCYKKKL